MDKSTKADKRKASKTTKKLLFPSEKMELIEARKLKRYKSPPSRKYWSKRILSQQLGMLFGPRGKGKTWLVVALAIAMSTGKPFLKRRAKSPVRVVYLDGEMTFQTMRKRFEATAKSIGAALTDNLRIFTPDTYSGVLPAVNDPDDHFLFDELLGDDWDVLFIDNYSAWSSNGSESGEAWKPFMKWMANLKRKGKTVIVVHHTGKDGKQRGTSRHEDALDFSISLRPVDTDDGSLSFSLIWTKARHLSPDDSAPITATMNQDEDGELHWTHIDGLPIDKRLQRMRKLRDKGWSISKIAEKLKVNKSTVSRKLNRA